MELQPRKKERKGGKRKAVERSCSDFTQLLFGKTFNAHNMNRTHAGRPSKHHGGIQHTPQPQVTDETLDHVWDTFTTCDCMKVRAGMRSRVAQAGRQADITNRAQMMMTTTTTGVSSSSAALTLLVAANISTTDP